MQRCSALPLPLLPWLMLTSAAAAVAQEPAPACDTHIMVVTSELRESNALQPLLRLMADPEARQAVGLAEPAWQLLQTTTHADVHLCGLGTPAPFLLVDAHSTAPQQVVDVLRTALAEGSVFDSSVHSQSVRVLVAPPGSQPPALPELESLPVRDESGLPQATFLVRLDATDSRPLHALAVGPSVLTIEIGVGAELRWTHTAPDLTAAADTAAQARALVELGTSSPLTGAGGLGSLIGQTNVHVDGTVVSATLTADAAQLERLINLAAEVIASELP